MSKTGYIKRHRLRILLSLLIVLPFLMNAIGVFELRVVQGLENDAYDLRLRRTMPNTPEKSIVIVDIDERSLREQGHWPWSRNKLARMVDLLFDRYKIDTLGFDMVFPERDDSSGLKGLEALARGELRSDAGFNAALGKLRPELNYDQLFADSLKNRHVALGYYFNHHEKQGGAAGALPPPALARGTFDPKAVGARVAVGFAANLPELQSSGVSAGYFSFSPLEDSDGVLRRVPLMQAYQGDLYEALGLAVARLALREPKVELGYVEKVESESSLEYLRLGSASIPVDIDMAALIPYRGMEKSFPYVSASDVLQGTASVKDLQGAIVLVGTTAPGLQDLRTAPVQESFPGVEVHANLIAGILQHNIKMRPDWTYVFEFILLFVVGVLLALALPALRPLWAVVLSVAATGSVLVFNLILWKENLVVPLASSLVLIGLLFIFNTLYGFVVEDRGKRQLSGLFGQYVPPELVEEMAEDPGAFSLAGESREMTVLFSDVRGFTTISEGLDPTQLTALMNEFLTPMTHVIHHHRGTIDKYMGDAIMAFWGAPLHDEQHARHALLAAMEMISTLEGLQDHFKAKGWPPIKVGVGLSTGEMTVGNMGSEFRLAYTVMGDSVNLGSRLESLTKEYGVAIMVSEYTRAAVPDFVFRELDRVRVKGKDKPVAIFQPICQQGQEDPAFMAELALYEAALGAYRAQNWPSAEEQFAQLRSAHPDCRLYELYAQRITYLRHEPPGADWDGSFTFTTK